MYLYLNTPLNKVLNYSFVSQTTMRVNKQTVLQQQIEQHIDYLLTEKDNNEAYTVFLKRTTNPNGFSDNLGNMFDVSRFLNKPYESLHLKLYANGELAGILNQKIVAKKWAEVKKTEEFRQMLTSVNEKNFFQELDEAYERSLDYIRKTPNYIVFFPPVYRLKYDSEHSARFELFYNSIIFVGNIVRFKLHFFLDRVENGIVYFKSKTLKFDTSNRDIEKLYKKGYGAIVQSPLEEYLFSYEAEHRYDLQTGKLLQVEAVFREQANADLIYENKINIQLKPVGS